MDMGQKISPHMVLQSIAEFQGTLELFLGY